MGKSSTRKLNTKAYFYSKKPVNGPMPGEDEDVLVHRAWSEPYSPSVKDLDVLNGLDVERSVTIVIRDPRASYIPKVKDTVKLFDYRYSELIWEILEVRHDVTANEFVTILLGVVTVG